MRRSGAAVNVLLAVGVVLLVASVFVFRGGSSASKPPASPQSVAEAFAGSYLRYLDGQIPLSQLPDADAGVLRAADGAIIPARLRAGQLTLALMDVYDVSRTAARATFGARDRKHHLATTISLARRAGTWEVVGLVPPDFSQLYPPPKTPPAPSAAQTAASTFALAYLDYREGVRRQPPAGQALIAREIAGGQDPLAHIAATHRAAHLDGLELGPVTNGTVAATAQLSDAGSSTTILFTMQKEAGTWVASQFIISR
ncbi:MAG TPA: hypothetical protein VFH80_22160 [Solirubrobacteraceae bacterium]|nr:hypothetical protein [Solirubrobacteraceae bacterium]